MRAAFLVALFTLLAFGAELLEPSSPFVRRALQLKRISAKWVSPYLKKAPEAKAKRVTSEQRKALAKFFSSGHDAQPQTRVSVTVRMPVLRVAHEIVSFYRPPQLTPLERPPSA